MSKKRRKNSRLDDLIATLGDAWTLYHAIALVAGIILFFAGLFAWGYVISESGGSCKRLLRVEIVVQAVMLIGSIVRIGLFDYEENISFHIQVTFAVNVLVSVVGYYIANIHVMQVTGAVQTEAFYYIIDFFVEILIAAALGFLPSIVIAVLMWVLVRIFAKPL